MRHPRGIRSAIGDRRQEIRDRLHLARKATSIAIDNIGKGGAEKVSILVDKEPYHIECHPIVPIQCRSTADGRWELEFSGVEPSSQQILTFYGIRYFDIARVSLSGSAVNEVFQPTLRPEKDKEGTISMALVTFVLIIFGSYLFGFFMGYRPLHALFGGQSEVPSQTHGVTEE